MLSLISLALEVEVVIDGEFSASLDGSEDDLHVEFTPSLLLDLKGCLFLHYDQSELSHRARP